MNQHSQSTFLNRVSFLVLFQCLVGVIIITRLFVLQVLYTDRYKNLAEENRTRVRVQFAHRGQILDRWGVPVATNIQSYTALILPEDSRNIKDLMKSIAPILELTAAEQEKILKEIRKKPKFIPTVLKNNITWDQVAKIELHGIELPGFYTEEGRARNYLLKENASHLMGYTSTPSEKEVKKNKIMMMPGARIGKNGIEAYYEEILKGQVGQKSVEVNSRGRVIRELSTIDSHQGQSLKLTIDKDLQEYISQLLAPYKSVSAIVVDIKTGEILSLVSMPGYNPNLFFHGIRKKDWDELMQNPTSPLINKVISGQYSPGSAFKIIVALAALENGVKPSLKVNCPGHMMLGKHKFHCWEKKGHGTVDMSQALYRSCDVYFYQIARQIGQDAIVKMARKLGVGSKVGIDLPAEQSGFIADPDWKMRVRKEPWYPGDTVLLSIGQGYVLMTPLQLVTMISTVANGGYKINPHLKLESEKKPDAPSSLGLNPDHLKFIVESLGKTVNDPTGSAYKSRIKEAGCEMGGKTSTAQVKRISMKERLAGVREAHQLPWHLRDTSEFVGFAPVDNPRYAVAIVGEHEGWGSGFAAPKARDILLKTQQIMADKEKQMRKGEVHA